MNGGRPVPLEPVPAYVNGFVDGSDLILLYRDAAGQMRGRRHRAEWSNFFRRSEISEETMRDLRTSEFVAGLRLEGEWVRVRWRSDDWRRKAHEEDGYFDSIALESYEADVDPIRRHFSETGHAVVSPSRVYVDIETDSRVPPAIARRGKARVLCWSIVVDDEPTRDCRDPAGLRVVASNVLAEDTDDAEQALLEEFWQAAEPFDQMAAWFGDGFDFPILKARSERVGARAKDPRRWLYIDQLVVHERMNRNAAESGDEKESMRLQDVAMELVGEGKNEFDASKTYEEWAAGGERRERMRRYCVQDTMLLPKIERKTGYLALNGTLCELARCFQTTANVFPIPIVDGFLLRMGVERGLRFPHRRKRETNEKFAGAFVMEPKYSGIRKNVHVFDFSGMYPSIMLSWNMSPETIDNACPVNGPIPDGTCRAPSTRVGFKVNPSGLVPEALKEIRAKRKQWQKRQAELPPGTPEWYDAGRRSNAYKVAANVFYGATGSPFCRFFDRRVAESTSQNGAWLIRKTLHAAEERERMDPTYADTDSGFVERSSREKVDEFVKWCNSELYPRLVAESGCIENHVEVAYEKEFERVVFCGKKRYFGRFRHFKWTTACTCTTAKGEPGALDVRKMTCRDCGKVWTELPPPRGKPEIKGLEYKRGDAIVLARRFQWRVIEKLIVQSCEDPSELVPIIEDVKRHVLEDELPIEQVRLSKSLSKSLREYKPKKKADGTDAAEPPHVQVARILKERGEQIEEGVRVSYYVVDASDSPMKVAPAADYAGECDRFYLWENLIYPATMRVLDAAFPVVQGMSGDEMRMRDWGRYSKVRPKRERRRTTELKPLHGPNADASPVQFGLFAPRPPDVFAVDLSSVKEWEGAVARLREIVARNPGSRRAVARREGAEIELGGIAWSAALVGEFERAKGG